MYSFETPLTVGISVLLATLESLLVCSFIKQFWDIQQFIHIRKLKRNLFYYSLRLTLPVIGVLLVVNVLFDCLSQQINSIGYLRLTVTYLVTLLLNRFIKNHSLFMLMTLLFGFLIRGLFLYGVMLVVD
ncbi:hypothetical protein [Enterococcus sp. AZ194]|uniref:hypothetical protein n=1 Tax=Enterococcus sp. AZ194 TaxID=2774629 RepID=UPI003F683CE4